MAKKNSQWAQVGKHKLELSNLEKVLFPEDEVVKAEILQYYLNIAPTILHHIKGRAMTLIRFPDGIHGESFYQKNRPEWAPDWIEFEKLGSIEKDYIIATEPALLVWIANLAGLELHQLHSRKPNFDKPDYMVFDLDPPEGYDFKKIVPIAFDLKEHIESFGYHAFVKTTGGKGIHICCPLEPQQDFSTVFDAAQLIAQPFVDKQKDTTLHIKKEARKGRVLVDIYRIRSGQSIVSPYSLRARIGAPVSMPITWEELETLENPKVYNIRNAVDKVLADGDAWESFGAYAVELHTHRKTKISVGKKLPVNKKHKTPEQLETYKGKRDFEKTPEPVGKIVTGSNNNFVVHRHHATNLHYDLRLEKDGVLKSWAVPKGFPPRPGVKRLAVQTEDHPMEYLTFHGKIPKGEYGGGDMWIYALGKYQITKEKKDGFYFRLNSKEMSGEYRIHNTKGKEYLLERVDEPQVDFINRFVEPMLSESRDKPPTSEDFIYEIKWDGIRALVTFEDGKVRIHTRNQHDVTAQFPELLDGDKAFRATNAVFDAEIVSLDESGKPVFKKVINRLMTSGEKNILKASKTNPCYCYIFDCLYLDGRPIINDPLVKRKEWLRDAVKFDTPYRVSDFVEDGQSLFAAARDHGLEGIMAKKSDSKYLPGKRTDCWYKIKVRQSSEVFVIGYTKGKGERGITFGALHIAESVDGKLHYRGKVGTGFDESTIKDIVSVIKKVGVVKKPNVVGQLIDEKISTWIEPIIIAEVSYSRLTPDKMFREPVFIKLRLDLSEIAF